MFGDSIGVQDGPALRPAADQLGITIAVHNWAGPSGDARRSTRWTPGRRSTACRTGS
jgi:hypothetical protein